VRLRTGALNVERPLRPLPRGHERGSHKHSALSPQSRELRPDWAGSHPSSAWVSIGAGANVERDVPCAPRHDLRQDADLRRSSPDRPRPPALSASGRQLADSEVGGAPILTQVRTALCSTPGRVQESGECERRSRCPSSRFCSEHWPHEPPPPVGHRALGLSFEVPTRMVPASIGRLANGRRT
jgi:hypothetical protein